ncbi:hypothetical protein CsatB_001590 [Cannabis sativa]|uniref:uncharacterized protein LOC133039876 n=1 Tax=Cannabis sativa TaxID=3483 RepID=UPI0029C9E22B|nr:uncharacterized protein LOC133039876 [Cannabis sativa]
MFQSHLVLRKDPFQIRSRLVRLREQNLRSLQRMLYQILILRMKCMMGEKSLKLNPRSMLRAQRSLKTLTYPKKNPPKEWDYIYDQKNLFIVKAVSTATFQVIQNIKSCLSPEQLEMFSKTCFGHFLKLPEFKVQPQVFHGLLLREVQQPNDAKLWVMIRGVRIRFSIEEFVLIAGLDCEGDCSVLDFKQDVNSLCEKYWPTSSSITKESVRECFTTKQWGDSDEDAVKLPVLYFIEWFLLSGTKIKNVPRSILDVVDNGGTMNLLGDGVLLN